MKKEVVLLAGGTGLVGEHLAPLLTHSGYEVALLSRRAETLPYRSFQWSPSEGLMDERAVASADYIINLAGARITEGRWTKERKQNILQSRLDTTALLVRELTQRKHSVKAFISSSAFGVYGDTGDQIVDEKAPLPPTTDFLAEVCQRWEKAAEPAQKVGVRTVIMRTGLVLSPEEGALSILARAVKWRVGAPFGSGRQYISWIHIHDLCRMFCHALTHPAWQGPYNAVAPRPVTNREFMQIVARVLRRPILLPGIPAAFLRLARGEMSDFLLRSYRLSAQKALNQGFGFTYPALQAAIESFYIHPK